MTGARGQGSVIQVPDQQAVLPAAVGLDVGVLARLFDDATNSYKHLFFRALLDEFRERGFQNRVFPLSRLAVGMLGARFRSPSPWPSLSPAAPQGRRVVSLGKAPADTSTRRRIWPTR